jgi:hypothetical protein
MEGRKERGGDGEEYRAEIEGERERILSFMGISWFFISAWFCSFCYLLLHSLFYFSISFFSFIFLRFLPSFYPTDVLDW